MEAAGLAIGVVGLIGLFSVCVQLFEMAEAARTKDDDLGLIQQRLQMQWEDFTRWAKPLRLDRGYICKCAGISARVDAQILNMTERTLVLFKEGASLCHRHSAQAFDHGLHDPVIKSRLRFGRRRQRRAKVRRMRSAGQWVVRDRKRLAGIVDRIEVLMQDLKERYNSVRFKHLRLWKRRTCHLLRLHERNGTNDRTPAVSYANMTTVDTFAQVGEII